MLDRDAGWFRLGPDDVRVPAARRYLPGTMVLETSWEHADGWIIVRDVLLMGPWHHDEDRSQTHRRAPTDYDADHVLLRTVRCVNGEVQLSPGLRAGRSTTAGEPRRGSTPGDGYHQAVGDGPRASTSTLRLTTDIGLGFEGAARARARRCSRRATAASCALSWSRARRRRTTTTRPTSGWCWTAHHWQHWLAHGSFPDHPWRGYLQRSALTLKGLTYAPTGRADRRGAPRRCPRRPAASATGTTATPGSATPRSRSGASTRSASTGRPTTSSTSSPTWPRRRGRPADHVRHRRRARADRAARSTT